LLIKKEEEEEEEEEEDRRAFYMVLGCNSIIRCYACHMLNLFMINKKLSTDIVKISKWVFLHY
jgi:hypothetical protein